LKHPKSPFKWRHFEPTIILLCVRWYCRYQLSYRDLEEMMRERGLPVDHTTVWRWVQRYAPEINKRMRPYLKMSGTSYRIDETYVKVGMEWKYPYRAVDSMGCTNEFMLSARRDVSAAKRFFQKLMRADHRRLPFTIGTDKNASYPEAFTASVKEKVLPGIVSCGASSISTMSSSKTIEPYGGGGERCSASAPSTTPSESWKELKPRT
jgi:transposase-like protein